MNWVNKSQYRSILETLQFKAKLSELNSQLEYNSHPVSYRLNNDMVEQDEIDTTNP